MESNRVIIAVAWMTLSRERIIIPPDLRLYKIRRVEHAETYATWQTYDVAPVPNEDYDRAFRWARTTWPCWGVWHRELPGLIWSPDLAEVQRAFAVMAPDDRHPLVRVPELERAPVRYAPRQTAGAYRFLRSTRSRHDLWQLRSRYPNAGELSFVPSEVLYRRFGEGLPT